MNLQRYVSTVYSEQIEEEDHKAFDEELKELFPGLKFKNILDSYTQKYIPYQTNDSDTNYILDNLLFEKIFSNTVGKLFKEKENTIVLFPIYHDIDGKSRLRKEIAPIYTKILGQRDSKIEFVRKDRSNHYMFVPAFSDEEESNEEYKERLTQYFNRWFDFIQELKPKPTDLVSKPLLKFDTICYTVDHSGNFFTHYYKTKLVTEKSKILNQCLSTFLERLGLNNRSEIKDPILQVTPENATRKYKADGMTLTEKKITALMDVIKKFIDIYKRTNDKEYLKTATARDQQSIFRIYYRVNRTDELEDFTTLKTGSTYVYKMTDNKGKTRFGYFIEKEGIQTSYSFREYTGITKKFQLSKDKDAIKHEIKQTNGNEKALDDLFTKGSPMIINITKVGSVIYYKQNIKGDYEKEYDGTVEFFSDLHNYEHYKWFNFRDMNGALTSDTNIKFYENILFDKKSLIGFLTEKKEFTPQTKLNQMFLKINQDNSLLLEYSAYVMRAMRDTHSFTKGNIEKFIETTKRSIVEILFETNQLLYLTIARSSKEKTDISKNYKMVQYKYYETKDEKEAIKHFEKKIEKDEESAYCGRSHQCDLSKVIKNKVKDKIEYAVVIVEVTRENIEVDSTLKSKTNCKKLYRSLRRQIQPFLVAFAPRWGGTRKYKVKSKGKGQMKKNRLRTRRRKYRH